MIYQQPYTFLVALLAASISSSAFISPSPSFTANTKSSVGAYTNGDTCITASPAIPIAHRGNVSKQNLPPSSMPNGGRITMVGSGPGDPDLLTMAAHKILADPDALVISDRLVSKEILDLIQGEYKIARKLPGCADAAQDEVSLLCCSVYGSLLDFTNAMSQIYNWCKEGLDTGKHVVRLKIGDPFVFGRGGEEVLKFREFGVEPKVIPVSIVTKNSMKSRQ